ncbi:hypothetical protein ASPZODRAFT_19837 [Penicilliopsis zonata CBS 506.65]|uniref:Uncharacterized protein n=1 Tax=Penicilliopsis zonata CBS 506.65 TaxID=1073090 RepID=A0A1L9S7L7_9EURO|nr:hypothetical protein ASPZODRAFT_19837 [Penicilliopsis zonata CBS 506.65]OJJ43146.1 hypothetical protein ASPZODRAFT_19837 [Penicilliopsis zonata CBS 506.65]
MHPNIPISLAMARELLERLGLMVVAVICPEMIITAAWSQRRQALQLLKDIDLTGEAYPLSQTQTPSPWALEQAMFAVMGGFVVDRRFQPTLTGKEVVLRRQVTAEDVSFLARTGLLPNLSVQDVQERSNADFFAKEIVLIQILWFAIQVFGRLDEHLPVTLLETHTIIHVGCAFVMYAIWLRKAYDLKLSIVLTGEHTDCVLALLPFYEVCSTIQKADWQRYQTSRMEYWQGRAIQAARGFTGHSAPPRPPASRALAVLIEDFSKGHEDNVDQDYNRKILYQLASEARRGVLKPLRHSAENFAIRNVWGGWSADVGHDFSLDKGLHVAFSVLYRGAHLAAWSSPFPTTMERVLWRISALALTTAPVWGLLWVGWWQLAR